MYSRMSRRHGIPFLPVYQLLLKEIQQSIKTASVQLERSLKFPAWNLRLTFVDNGQRALACRGLLGDSRALWLLVHHQSDACGAEIASLLRKLTRTAREEHCETERTRLWSEVSVDFIYCDDIRLSLKTRTLRSYRCLYLTVTVDPISVRVNQSRAHRSASYIHRRVQRFMFWKWDTLILIIDFQQTVQKAELWDN